MTPKSPIVSDASHCENEEHPNYKGTRRYCTACRAVSDEVEEQKQPKSECKHSRVESNSICFYCGEKMITTIPYKEPADDLLENWEKEYDEYYSFNEFEWATGYRPKDVKNLIKRLLQAQDKKSRDDQKRKDAEIARSFECDECVDIPDCSERIAQQILS